MEPQWEFKPGDTFEFTEPDEPVNWKLMTVLADDGGNVNTDLIQTDHGNADADFYLQWGKNFKRAKK